MQQSAQPLAQPYLKVLVTGDRHWEDFDLIYNELRNLGGEFHPRPIMVIHGGATGADAASGAAAARLGMALHVYHAQWDRYGRAAGPKRNQLMIDENPDIALCLVVHDDLPRSRGTRDCWQRAINANIPVRFIRHQEAP